VRPSVLPPICRSKSAGKGCGMQVFDDLSFADLTTLTTIVATFILMRTNVVTMRVSR
jgi:hypothetical protein